MRSKFISNTLLLLVASQLMLGTGCAWWHRHFGPQTHAGVGGTGSGPGTIGSGVPIDNNGGLGGRPELSDEALRGRSQFTPVYFDYDSATIKASELPKFQAVVDALKGNNKKLIVEGHTDERGTAEYNRALGERRAEAAQKALVGAGVDASRITTISYGKDRPADPSHVDTAWSRNRRCEFVIVAGN